MCKKMCSWKCLREVILNMTIFRYVVKYLNEKKTNGRNERILCCVEIVLSQILCNIAYLNIDSFLINSQIVIKH